MPVRLCPKTVKRELDSIERWLPDPLIIVQCYQQQPVLALQLVDLESFGVWIDEPEMGNTVAGMARQLDTAIGNSGRRRHDLAYSIGRELKPGRFRQLRHPLSAPTGDVRNQDVARNMQFGFIDDRPATRSADTAIGWATQAIAQCRIGTGMPGGRTGMGMQYAT